MAIRFPINSWVVLANSMLVLLYNKMQQFLSRTTKSSFSHLKTKFHFFLLFCLCNFFRSNETRGATILRPLDQWPSPENWTKMRTIIFCCNIPSYREDKEIKFYHLRGFFPGAILFFAWLSRAAISFSASLTNSSTEVLNLFKESQEL